MRFFGMPVALMGLAFAAPAAAKSEVSIAVTRADAGDWIVQYDFRIRSPVWFFPRSQVDLQSRPWRQQSWTVETPGVRLDRAGRYDVLVSDGGAPLARVRIRMRPFARPLIADYTPALRFSDGGLALFGAHFAPAPAASVAAVAAFPVEIEGRAFRQPLIDLVYNDPGRRLLLGGRSFTGQARASARTAGSYVYAGDAPVIDTEAFAGVIDPGLPPWVRAELDMLTPRLLRLYTERLGKPLGGRPMALVAWQGADHPGWSLGGSVLAGMVVLQISGQAVLEPGDAVRDQARWWLGHESAHFWMGQTLHYRRRNEGWITEGSADLLAIRALQQLVPGYDPAPRLQAGIDRCLEVNGPGEPLATAEERGEHGAYYACGSMLLLAAEAAARAEGLAPDVFAWLRGLIDARRAFDGETGIGEWLAHFGRAAGAEQAAAVRAYIEKGVEDPRAFFIRLFTAAGVAFEMRGNGLRLL